MSWSSVWASVMLFIFYKQLKPLHETQFSFLHSFFNLTKHIWLVPWHSMCCDIIPITAKVPTFPMINNFFLVILVWIYCTYFSFFYISYLPFCHQTPLPHSTVNQFLALLLICRSKPCKSTKTVGLWLYCQLYFRSHFFFFFLVWDTL